MQISIPVPPSLCGEGSVSERVRERLAVWLMAPCDLPPHTTRGKARNVYIAPQAYAALTLAAAERGLRPTELLRRILDRGEVPERLDPSIKLPTQVRVPVPRTSAYSTQQDLEALIERGCALLQQEHAQGVPLLWRPPFQETVGALVHVSVPVHALIQCSALKPEVVVFLALELALAPEGT